MKKENFIEHLCKKLNVNKDCFQEAISKGIIEISEWGNNVYRIIPTKETSKFLSDFDYKVRTANSENFVKILDTTDSHIEDIITKIDMPIIFTTNSSNELKEFLCHKVDKDYVSKTFLFKKLGKYNIAIKKPWWYKL